MEVPARSQAVLHRRHNLCSPDGSQKGLKPRANPLSYHSCELGANTSSDRKGVWNSLFIMFIFKNLTVTKAVCIISSSRARNICLLWVKKEKSSDPLLKTVRKWQSFPFTGYKYAAQIGGCCRCLRFDLSLQIAWQRRIILVSNQSAGCVKKLRKGTVCVAAQDGSSRKTTGGSPVRHVPAMHTKPVI